MQLFSVSRLPKGREDKMAPRPKEKTVSMETISAELVETCGMRRCLTGEIPSLQQAV